MKVCIFTETYYPEMGGGETQAKLLAEGLIARGHSVIVLTRRSDISLRKHERYGGVDVYRLAPSGGGQLKKWALLFPSIPMLVMRRDQYDLIFVSGYRILGLVAVLIGKFLRKPVVLKGDSQGEMSGGFFESGLRNFGMSRSSFLFRLFLRLRNDVLKKANAFCAISPDIFSEWVSSGVPSNRIYRIPNGVDTSRFIPVNMEQKSRLREKLDLPQSTTIAIFTGRLVSYKGLPLLLKVWKEIRCKHENVLLLLVGTGGLDMHNCEEGLREYVKSSSLERHVLFTGAVRNVEEYLQASDIFVFPTENEAFGASLVEAMACGLPVVTTPVGAIKTIVSDGENGILIEPGSFEQIYEALEILILDRSFVSKLGQAARRTAHDRYSADIISRKYLSVFQSVTSGSIADP